MPHRVPAAAAHGGAGGDQPVLIVVHGLLAPLMTDGRAQPGTLTDARDASVRTRYRAMTPGGVAPF